MLETSLYVTLGCILTVLVAIFTLIPSMYFGLSDRVQRRSHVVALLLLLWALFQSTLSLNRWYMDRQAGWFHHSFPYFFMTIILLLLFFTPRGKEFAKHLHPRFLILPQFTRVFWLVLGESLIEENQLPEIVFFLGIGMELILLIPFLYIYLKMHETPKIWIRLTHVMALIITLSELILGYGSIPSSIQIWSTFSPNYAFQHFPFTLIPSVLFPIYIFGNIHGIIFPSIKKKS
jgi:hypothetical protein